MQPINFVADKVPAERRKFVVCLIRDPQFSLSSYLIILTYLSKVQSKHASAVIET